MSRQHGWGDLTGIVSYCGQLIIRVSFFFFFQSERLRQYVLPLSNSLKMGVFKVHRIVGRVKA